MLRREVAINDIAEVLADLKVEDRRQRVAILRKTLQSMVNFAISDHELSKLAGCKDDLAAVAAIHARSKAG